MDNQETVETPPENVETPPPAPEPRIHWIQRAQAGFEVLLASGLLSSALAALPFALTSATRANLLADVRVMLGYIVVEALITLSILFLLLRAHRESFRSLGFTARNWFVEAAVGISIVPIFFLVNVIITVIFEHFFPQYFLKHNPLTDLIRSPRDLLLFIGTVLLAGGLKEEFQRAFILRRFQSYLGGSTLGLILWSVCFGMGHYVQGIQGIAAATLFGLLFGIVYLARGSLIAPIIAHSLYDTLALLGYWFFTPHAA